MVWLAGHPARQRMGTAGFDKAGADLLFGFVSQRYERRSLVVTTNLPFCTLVRGVPRCYGRPCGHRPDRAPRHHADDRRRQLPAQGRHTQPRVLLDTGGATAMARRHLVSRRYAPSGDVATTTTGQERASLFILQVPGGDRRGKHYPRVDSEASTIKDLRVFYR